MLYLSVLFFFVEAQKGTEKASKFLKSKAPVVELWNQQQGGALNSKPALESTETSFPHQLSSLKAASEKEVQGLLPPSSITGRSQQGTPVRVSSHQIST